MSSPTTKMTRLPEEIRDAVFWLNIAGRSLVADSLAAWFDSLQRAKPSADTDLVARLYKTANDQHVFPYLRDDCREAAQVICSWHDAYDRWEGQREELYATISAIKQSISESKP